MKYFIRKVFVSILLFATLLGLLSLKPKKPDRQLDSPQSILDHIRFHSKKYAEYRFDKAFWMSSSDSILIPLRRVGRLMMLEARIDGETGYLVFDTGASGLVLNKSYFRNHVVFSSQNSKGITGKVDAEKIAVDSLEISGIIYTGQTAEIANLGHIENRRGVKILGLFGFALLRKFEVIIDVQHNQLQLNKIDAFGNRTSGKNQSLLAGFTQKFELQNNILLLKGNIGGKNLKYCLDTGAETNVIDNNSPKEVLKTITITRRTHVRGASSIVNEVLYGKMTDFKLGPIRLDSMETIIVNLQDMSEAYNNHIDGMLGFTFLSKGVFCINFVKKEMSISFTKREEI